ncbi:MAG: hypothetical protein Q7V43_17895 [Myxococcales bacterium]|nr:hypothetical protein [Myxococcales bacterium]
MIRRWLSTGGRGGVVWGVAVIELGLAWLLALAATASLTGTLARHPLGAIGLHAQGGRLLGELVALHAHAWEPMAGLLGVVIVAHAGAWMLLGGMFPVLGATTGVRWHRAAAESLRRAPTLLGLAAIAGLGYALAGFAGYAAAGWAGREAAHRLDVRAITALGGTGWLLGGALAWAIGLWHDVARAHAMSRGRSAMQASGSAALQMAREPLATVAAGAGFGLVTWAYVGAAAALAGLLDARSSRPGVVAALLVAQHLVVLGRVHTRMKWFVWLGGRVTAARARAE